MAACIGSESCHENMDHVNSETEDSSAIKWVALGLVHIEYPAGDVLGKLFAMSSMLPVALIVSFITLILFRRDLHTIFYFAGLLLSEACNIVIKHVVREPRPKSRESLYNEYGMPSSHSQFMFFFTTYMLLFLWVRLHHISNSSTIRMWKTISSAGCIAASVIVVISRVYLQYHSVGQVLAGTAIGCILGGLWFLIVHYMLTPWFPTIVSWRICEHALIRDTTLIPNIMWFEYTSTRQECRARSRKLISMKSQ